MTPSPAARADLVAQRRCRMPGGEMHGCVLVLLKKQNTSGKQKRGGDFGALDVCCLKNKTIQLGDRHLAAQTVRDLRRVLLEDAPRALVPRSGTQILFGSGEPNLSFEFISQICYCNM